MNFLAELNREVQKSKIFIILPWIVDFHGKLPVFFVYPIIHTHKYIHIPKTVYGPETMIKTSPRGAGGGTFIPCFSRVFWLGDTQKIYSDI